MSAWVLFTNVCSPAPLSPRLGGRGQWSWSEGPGPTGSLRPRTSWGSISCPRPGAHTPAEPWPTWRGWDMGSWGGTWPGSPSMEALPASTLCPSSVPAWVWRVVSEHKGLCTPKLCLSKWNQVQQPPALWRPAAAGSPASSARMMGARLTAQRSVEDKGEAAPEQCQRERVGQLQAQDEDGGGHAPEQAEPETLLSLKASEVPELDEDEGFGDWSQRPEQQQREGAQGTPDGGEPPRCRSPEGEQEDRPGPHACGKGDSDEGHLEELSLSKEGPDPEDTVQDNRGAAGAEEEQEHRKCQQPRTPSPLVLEGTPEHSSPPLSPTTKLIDRTESLNRSIEKSNSVKKSQPDLPISRIDQRLEQYTQAIETSGRTPKLARQASIELPSMAVASTKSLWETGEVQAQSAAKTPSCKDIVAGDMSKKSLWEQKGGSKTSSTIKSTPSGKRYKFVATGHGKYEKVLVEGGPAP
nr:lymphocyte-specific protein 1 isoform X2 [Saimiri boliviensis boliviensis]